MIETINIQRYQRHMGGEGEEKCNIYFLTSHPTQLLYYNTFKGGVIKHNSHLSCLLNLCDFFKAV